MSNLDQTHVTYPIGAIRSAHELADVYYEAKLTSKAIRLFAVRYRGHIDRLMVTSACTPVITAEMPGDEHIESFEVIQLKGDDHCYEHVAIPIAYLDIHIRQTDGQLENYNRDFLFKDLAFALAYSNSLLDDVEYQKELNEDADGQLFDQLLDSIIDDRDLDVDDIWPEDDE